MKIIARSEPMFNIYEAAGCGLYSAVRRHGAVVLDRGSGVSIPPWRSSSGENGCDLNFRGQGRRAFWQCGWPRHSLLLEAGLTGRGVTGVG